LAKTVLDILILRCCKDWSKGECIRVLRNDHHGAVMASYQKPAMACQTVMVNEPLSIDDLMKGADVH
jgi:hypothetical protein